VSADCILRAAAAKRFSFHSRFYLESVRRFGDERNKRSQGTLIQDCTGLRLNPGSCRFPEEPRLRPAPAEPNMQQAATGITLWVKSESQARFLCSSMGNLHREPLRAAWDQAESRRNDDVYPLEEPHEDWPQNIPHVDQSGEEGEIPVFRQL
jgi:hypothetical protein